MRHVPRREQSHGLASFRRGGAARCQSSNPLFNPIDADDPTAATPTYEHLKKGLVRITLTLPDNINLINEDGTQVVTPPDRKFSVWRGVPTVENTFFTAPYQYDGRFPTYQIQAQGAIQLAQPGSADRPGRA